MSKVLRVVAVIAAVAAVVVSGGTALFGAAAFSSALGISAGTLATIGAVASATSALAGVGAQLLTKPPPSRGSVSQIVIAVDPPRPYVMGEGYVGGVKRYQNAYGATLNNVPNPYRWIVDVYSGGGTVDSISPRFDYQPVASYYNTFLYTTTQLGALPESAALVPNWTGAPGWSASSKLSGLAAIGWNFLFDKEGKRFSGGIPVMGAYGKWEKVYDPRLDSTFPGGSGAHRLGTESTYAWSENPALHFATYAYGRFQNGKKVVGVGLPKEGIDWPMIVAWANVCDANGWKIFGRIFEPGDRWSNLKDIAAAGGADPAFSGALLSVRYDAPRVSLGTVTSADIAEGQCSVTKMQPYTARLNAVVPKYIDPGSNWEMMQAQPIIFSSLVTEDGEERRQEYPFNLVKGVNQAAQLASYKVLNSREQMPIELQLLPQWRRARPGECYTVNLPELGLNGDCIVLKRELDPANGTVKLTMMSDTASKHALALAQVGTAAPVVATGQTGQQRDEIRSVATLPANGGVIYNGGNAATI